MEVLLSVYLFIFGWLELGYMVKGGGEVFLSIFNRDYVREVEGGMDIG